LMWLLEKREREVVELVVQNNSWWRVLPFFLFQFCYG
jgi:hypothetical protein